MIRALAELAEGARTLDAGEIARRRAALVRALQEAEWALRLALETEGDDDGLLARRDPQAAPERRDAVAEYYRRLSESPER